MSSLTNPFSYAELPNDVGRVVFEYLAEDPRMVLCATVSRRVQSWVERVIYRKVSLTTKEKGGLFHRTVQGIGNTANSTKPRDFLASHVKSLLIQPEVEATLVAPILEACTGVTNLALNIPDTSATPQLWVVLASGELAPTHLSIPGSALPDAHRNFRQPVFRNVTHLELFWEDEYDLDLEWGSLRSMKRLTHLSVDMQFDPIGERVADIVKDLLVFCPRTVRLFVIWVIFESYFDPENEQFEGIMALHRGEIDSRVVVGYSIPEGGDLEETNPAIVDMATFLSYDDSMAGWDPHSTLTGETLWSRAEERIELRTKDSGGGTGV